MTRIRYTPESQLRRPRQFLDSGRNSVRASRSIAGRLLVRSVRTQYRQSFLGYLWLIIPTLGQVGLWVLLNASNIVNTGQTSVPFVAYVVIGVLLWQGFVDALNGPLQVLTQSAQLLTRINFPIESLLIAGLGEVLLNMLVRMVVLVPVLIGYRVAPSWSLVMFPLGVASIVLIGFAIGLLIAPFGVLYQDVQRVLSISTQFIFLVSPVAYALPKNGYGRFMDRINPLAPLLRTSRSWLSGGPFAPPLAFVIVVLASLVVAAAGWVIVRLSVPHLVDRIAAF